MGNHRADVTSDSPRSVTPSPEAPTSTYVGKRRAAPVDRPASRPASRATGSTYVGKRRAAPSTDTLTPASTSVPEEPLAKPRRERVVLDPTGAMPTVDQADDHRISTGELRAMVEGDLGSTAPSYRPAPSVVPEPRRAPQIDPTLANLLSSMGIDPEKVTPQVLDDLGIGSMSTTELAAFLTQPTKPAPSGSAAPRPEPGFGRGPADFHPEPKISSPSTPAAPAAPEPIVQAPEPQSAPTPKPLRMANTFAPLTGKFPAVRHAAQEPQTPASMPLPPTTPPPSAPAPAAPASPTTMPTPPRGLYVGKNANVIAGATPARGVRTSDVPFEGFVDERDEPRYDPAPTPARFRLDEADFSAPPTPLPYEIDVDSMALEMPTGAYDFRDDAYEDDAAEAYFRADTGASEVVELPSLSQAATYSQELAAEGITPAVETTGTMVGVGDPTRHTTRRSAAAAAGRRSMLPLTAGAAAVLAAISGVAMTGGPATSLAADDARLVGATALGGQSAMVSVGGRGTTVTRDSDRTSTDLAASTRAKALAGLDVKAEKQDKFLKSNLWGLPIPYGQYHITGTFGSAGVHWATVHTGLDFAAPTGTPIHAIARGTVTETAWGGAYGNRTIITLDDGTEIWYCHQSRYGATVGEKVSPGQIIGYVGATGNVTGPHVHVEVRPGGGDPVDPNVAMAEHGADPTP